MIKVRGNNRTCGLRVQLSMVDSSSADFTRRIERAWLISKQPGPIVCSSCDSKGHIECKWCAGTGFFILGDNMLCEVPSRNTTCIICTGKEQAFVQSGWENLLPPSTKATTQMGFRSPNGSRRMKIAVEGCMHGDLDNVYRTLQQLEKSENTKIDLLLCCGDFQAVRNEHDLKSLNVPLKYRSMNSFWKYYSGAEVAPYPTIFIGGNHEASNYLWELYYGGWAAPNIYFLGAAGVVRFGNVRIGGLSGIYKSFDYKLGHFERPPYDHNTIKSVYHVREYDVRKLMQVKEPIDVFLSHDWPVRITDYGDWRELVRRKHYFKQEIEEKRLGSKPAAELLEKLKPHYWFSAHLHCKFAALVQHGEGGPLTKFLALDKCIPGRDFLQIVEIESDAGPYEIQYDEEWLAITRKFNPIFPLTYKGADFRGINLEMEDCLEWVRSKLQERGCKPFEFVRTAPCYDPSRSNFDGAFAVNPRNPQTESFLRLLELPYLFDRNPEAKDLSPYPSPSIQRGTAYDSEDIPIDDVADDDDDDEELPKVDNVETETSNL
ncbi:Lariat debranching enzyme [Glycine soja]